MANKNKRRSSTPTQAVVNAPKAASRTFTPDFKPDYTYVKEDLKRIAYLAAGFIVILVVLSFFLR